MYKASALSELRCIQDVCQAVHSEKDANASTASHEHADSRTGYTNPISTPGNANVIPVPISGSLNAISMNGHNLTSEHVFYIRLLLAKGGLSEGPLLENKDLIRIRLYTAFEPHGRASETWEDVWLVELPMVHGMYKDLKGWHFFLKDTHMTFKARDLEGCLYQAREFLEKAPWAKINEPY